MNTQNIELLKRVSLFAKLPEAAIAQIARDAEVRQLEKGDTLIQRDDPATSFFIIRTGWVKVVTGGSEDKELVLNQIRPGQIIGETSLIHRNPHATTAIALTPVQAIEIKYDTFLAVLEQDSSLALAFTDKLLDRLQFADLYVE
ncbi:MAG TPA: cyclic nucleotide-binding domain-containing protein, partial [Anaerolineae bacterium]|nr:cyclic nucleotide-binding domain-containing protein [Anaerolineae bacterium]